MSCMNGLLTTLFQQDCAAFFNSAHIQDMRVTFEAVNEVQYMLATFNISSLVETFWTMDSPTSEICEVLIVK